MNRTVIEAPSKAAGFTVLEVAVAAGLLAVAMTIVLGGFIYLLRGMGQSDAQNELDTDVQSVMESLKLNLRASALDKMFFYPAGSGPYTAVSFPDARDDNGDGVIERDAQGHIIWDRTLIYHVWNGSPNELRLTVFDPRNNALTDAQLQQQLNDVVAAGNGASTINGTNATTTALFQNLFQWSIRPQGARFDGYASNLSLRSDVVLGCCLVTNGPVKLTFQVVDTNQYSLGRKIGLDQLRVTPSGCRLEAEAMLPATQVSGPAPVADLREGGSWSGNYQLLFSPTAMSNSFSLAAMNDRWIETQFSDSDATLDGTELLYDETVTPKDYVLDLEGNDYTWYAANQTGDDDGASGLADAINGCAVRVVLRGDQMSNGAYLQCAGAKCKVNFRAGSDPLGIGKKLLISNAYIMQCAGSNTPSPDAVGTVVPLYFGGHTNVTINADHDGTNSVTSDWTTFRIDPTNSYLISYVVNIKKLVGNNQGCPWIWTEDVAASNGSCYIWIASDTPDDAEAKKTIWSDKLGDKVFRTNTLFAVQNVFVSYVTNGIFESQVFDTSLSAPAYTTVSWNQDKPSGTTVALKVRAGGLSDCTDAADWSILSSILSAPGAINSVTGRYVQFQAQLGSDSTCLKTPKVDDVTINWTGQSSLTDIGGTFTTGPDYGVFEMKVNDKQVLTALAIDLTIFKNAGGYNRTNTLTSKLTTELRPRNTGK